MSGTGGGGLGGAADALSRGDAVTALSALQGLAGEAASALRGVALAQVEEWDAAREELVRALGPATSEAHQARCRLALAEIELAARHLTRAREQLDRAEALFPRAADAANETWLAIVRVRLLVLGGDTDEAARLLEGLTPNGPTEACAVELARADVAARRFRPDELALALGEAARQAAAGGHERLAAVVDRRLEALRRQVAVVSSEEGERGLTALETAALFADTGQRVLLDGLRRRLLVPGRAAVDLRRRPVPLELLRSFVTNWPEAATAGELISAAFEESRPDESHHVRLRVALGRLRELLPDELGLSARGGAWRLSLPRGWRAVRLEAKAPEADESLLALLSDGEPWSAGDLADCSGRGLRAVQRALSDLVDEGLVLAEGRGRARRYRSSMPDHGIASQLLLVGLVDPR